jgi:DNA-binding transcriptional regulator YdaS (Cro superfamily)
MEHSQNSALERACQSVHGSTRLAQLLTERGRKVSKASVSRWKRERVPAEFCPDIEAVSGVLCEELRPDVRWDVLRAKCDNKKHTANPNRPQVVTDSYAGPDRRTGGCRG